MKGEYQSQKDLKWSLYFNPNSLPKGFMPEEKLRDWMASTISAVSGATSVSLEKTRFAETKPEELNEILRRAQHLKKSLPWMERYYRELQKKIRIVKDEEKHVRDFQSLMCKLVQSMLRLYQL